MNLHRGGWDPQWTLYICVHSYLFLQHSGRGDSLDELQNLKSLPCMLDFSTADCPCGVTLVHIPPLAFGHMRSTAEGQIYMC